MDYGPLIREVVKTYELPTSLESRIVAIAERRVHELHLNSTVKVYNYVDYLVGRFTAREEDKVTFSLDTSKFEDAKTFQQKLGVDDPNLAAYTERVYLQQQPLPNISVSEIVGILRGHLSELDVNILLQLMNQGVNVFDSSTKDLLLNRDHVVSQIPLIQERLYNLAQAYGRDGRLILPPRPIVYVKFNPEPYIRFGIRNYNGNPIAFFNAHPEVYGGIKNAGELWVFDKPLAEALYNGGQTSIAFPEYQPNTLAQSRVERILNSMASHFNYIHIFEDERFGLVGRVLNWKKYYGGSIRSVHSPTSEPEFIIKKPQRMIPYYKLEIFPFESDDGLHTLIENWSNGPSIRWGDSRGAHVANAFKKVDELQDGDVRSVRVQFYEIPELCLARFPARLKSRKRTEEPKAPDALEEKLST